MFGLNEVLARAPLAGSPWLHSRLVVALVAGWLLVGCADPLEYQPPLHLPGGIEGTVTLLGPDGPPNPVGVRIAMFASLADVDRHTPKYQSSLQRIAGDVRRYQYSFPLVEPGSYYVMACFEFGCGGYRHPETGELLRAWVSSAQVTALHFGI